MRRRCPSPAPPLAAHDGAEAAPRLPRATAGEQTVLDYAGTGLTLRAHPMALLRPQLDALGLADTRALTAAPQGRRLRLPGLVLVRQRPGSAKGVVFFTVEDEHGIANLVMYPDIAERFRAAVVAARLVVAEGRVERHGDRRGADHPPADRARRGPVRPAGRPAPDGGGALGSQHGARRRGAPANRG